MRFPRPLLALLAVAAITAAGQPGPEQQPPTPAPPVPLSQATGVGTLQSMMDAALPGATVHIPPGIYPGALVIDRPITLHAMGAVVVDGRGVGSVITITAPGVTLDGLTVQDSGLGPIGQPAGIAIEADDATIRNSTVRQSYIGIAVRGVAGSVIEHNTVLGDAVSLPAGDGGHAASSGESEPMRAMPGMMSTGPDGVASAPTQPTEDEAGHVMGGAQATTRGDGISLWNATDAQVLDNTVLGVRDGIYFSYGTHLLAQGNTVTQSRYAMHDMYALDLTIRSNTLGDSLSGLILMYGGPVVLQRNALIQNRSPSTGYGLLIKDADQVMADGNTIADNRVGIHMENGGARLTNAARLRWNTIGMNEVGIELAPASRAAFGSNTIAANTIPVLFDGDEHSAAVAWSIDGRGNYWGDYQGYDRNGDGIGDIAYEHPGMVERIVGRNSDLAVFASGPGFTLLGRLDSRWHGARAAVVDDAPLMRPIHPALNLSSIAGRPLWFPLAAFGLLVLCALLISRARRPRMVGQMS